MEKHTLQLSARDQGTGNRTGKSECTQTTLHRGFIIFTKHRTNVQCEKGTSLYYPDQYTK